MQDENKLWKIVKLCEMSFEFPADGGAVTRCICIMNAGVIHIRAWVYNKSFFFPEE